MLRSPSRRRIHALLLATSLIPVPATPALAQVPVVPLVRLLPASELSLPGSVDSNSPAVLDPDGSTLRVFNSVAGIVRGASGPSLTTFGPSTPVTWVNAPPGGSWMEAVLNDNSGTMYGYYHNEVLPSECPGNGRVRPRIGAARSEDQGKTWEDLGVILESAEPSLCDTTNTYDVGGVGDCSAILDRDNQYVYLFYSEYGPSLEAQGVAVARMPWADRDEPVGAMDVWSGGLWLPANDSETASDESAVVSWTYPTGTPVYPALRSWHSEDGTADAMWGPSVHWNTFLNEYVILMNHANTVAFAQEGIYVAFARALEAPDQWSAPQKVLSGGRWYPQVLGLTGDGDTDKVAGQRARFFISGTSTAEIEFGSIARKAAPPMKGRVPDEGD